MGMGQNVQLLRKARRLSLATLAEMSLVSIRTISRIEADDVDGLQPGSLRLIALALSVPEEEIAGERISRTSLTELVARFVAAGQQGGAAQGASGGPRLIPQAPDPDDHLPAELIPSQPRQGKDGGKYVRQTPHPQQPAAPAKKRGGSGGPKPGGPRKAG